jgi:hypothetical protein
MSNAVSLSLLHCCEEKAGAAIYPQRRTPRTALISTQTWPFTQSLNPEVIAGIRGVTVTKSASESPPFSWEEMEKDSATPLATSFRTWTSASDSSQPDLSCQADTEIVPGLHKALRRAGLSSYAAVTDGWCRDMGAAFLEDLLGDEELEELSSTLGDRGILLTPKACQTRLRRAIQNEWRHQQATRTW